MNMKRLNKRLPIYFAVLSMLILNYSCNSLKWTEEEKNGYNIVTNKGGKTLGYSTTSGVTLLEDRGYAFKDLNKNGTLEPYEDWRLSVDKRAKDLSERMTIEQIAGLMLYSAHQAVPSVGGGMFGGATYNGKPYAESGAKPSDLTDAQKKFLTDDNLRHVLITTVESPGVAAQWNNNAQALVESIGLGIPANTSTDPRHGTTVSAEYNAGAGGDISMWPTTLGLAATFDPAVMKKFGEIASIEYRALGIATALSPQIDLATEPRWSRFSGTMGEDPDLATDMARAYVDGFQTSEGDAEIDGGWGYQSVNAMVKHWPSGGPEEGGRDAHFGYGAYAVYPGNNLKDHLKPFTEGAFKLDGPTKMATAVMPYYTISYDIDQKNGENVGNSYNKYIITDLLRGEYGYDGVVCTDWMITADVSNVYEFRGKSWGVEKLTVAERHYKAIEAGVDQFGGNNEMGPVIEAYNMGVKEHGEEYMRQRFETSAVRLLKNIFRVGLFENPYLDVKNSEEVVGNPEFMQAGYESQIKSVVMLKNKNNILPIKERLKVYVPQKYVPGGRDWFGNESPASWKDAANLEIIEKYFDIVEMPDEADLGLAFINSPDGGVGYSTDDVKKGGNGYVPISLQYTDYKADFARDTSIAGGSPFEDFTDRSYKGKIVSTANAYDMKMVTEIKMEMRGKPVIAIVNTSKPMVFAELERSAEAILVHFGAMDQVILEIITGKYEPSALLPFQMPAHMKTVEEQYEDVSRDMECYTDSEGNTYDFAFGLNWSGLINDDRVKKYK